MRSLILVIAATGFAVFGTVFALSYVSQSFVETVGKEVIRLEVQRRVAEKVEALDGSRLVGLAERLSGRNAEELAAARRQLTDGLPAKVAETVARMRSLDCDCRRAVERRMTGLLEGRAATFAQLNERLALLIRTKYMETAERLTREFRIFSGANAMVFGILGAVTLLRRKAKLQLVLPTLVLLGAACLTAYFYVFQQDWLYTILFSEYVGLGYFGYLSLAGALLADIAFNRARITTAIVNAAGNVVGSAIQAVPC
jgi:uncharacterized membrane protein YeiB